MSYQSPTDSSVARRLAVQQRAVNAFNAANPVGTLVDYFETASDFVAGRPSTRTKTRSAATVLSGHTAVVFIDGKGGCVALSHVVPVRKPGASDGQENQS